MDAIGRQVTAFVTLFMTIALMLLMYLIFEPQRQSAAANEQRHASAERGAHLFAENCVVCHGPLGRGVAGAGFPLNLPKYKNPDEETEQYLRTTIARGRPNSTGRLPDMPAFSEDEGGQLNAQMITDLITFIGYGDWTEIPKILAQAGTPISAIPTPPGKGTPRASPVAAPSGDFDDPGFAVFENAGCNGCHVISPEFPAGGDTGPPLSNIGSKNQIPASQPTLPVNEEGLTAWIRDPQAIKPDAAMPPFDEETITDQQMRDLVRWLLSHR